MNMNYEPLPSFTGTAKHEIHRVRKKEAVLMHVEIPRPHDATELNTDGMIKLGNVYYLTEPILSIFSKEI